jgi:two-component system sensor histidine kinase YesM
MLQSQINPHFIYNTLESISMMATINDDDTTSDMASALGSILRYGISNYNAEVLVKDEIDNLEQYILLQDIRFNSMYTISIKMDSDIQSLRIIKLILQPIVENAIYHGMKNVRSNGKIEVIGNNEREILNFYVVDNGKGMDTKQTKLLNEYINDQNNCFKSIGLRNVNKRIKLRYGNDYGLFISSNPESGTKVHIKVPCVYSE